MSSNPLDALDREVAERKLAYREAIEAFLRTPKSVALAERRAAFGKCHSTHVDFVNAVERSVVTGCRTGADSDDVWFADAVDTAINVLSHILKHYKVVRKRAPECDLKPDSFLPSSKAYATLQRIVKDARPEDAIRIRKQFEEAGLPIAGFKERSMARRLSNWERVFVAVSGFGLLVGVAVLVVVIPTPTEMQEFALRLFLSLAAAGFVTTVVGGFLNIQGKWGKLTLRAGGGLAVFVLVWFCNPPKLVSRPASQVAPPAARSEAAQLHSVPGT